MIAAVLPDLLRNRVPAVGRTELPCGEGCLVLHVVAADSLACVLEALDMRRPGRAVPTTEATARRLVAASPRSLSEPLVLCEFDAASQVALVRSDRPAEAESGREYYEISVRGDSLLLNRYAFRPGTPGRERVAMTFAYPALRRLAEEFLAACDGASP